MQHSDAKRARMHELHAQGLSCHQIAKQLEISTSTVSRWAKADGLSFNRERTAAAVKAQTLDLAARRNRLLDMMLHTVEQTFANLNGPVLPRDIRDILTSAAIVYDKTTAALDQTPEDAKASSMVEQLERQIENT